MSATMTPDEQRRDGLASYDLAIAEMRRQLLRERETRSAETPAADAGGAACHPQAGGGDPPPQRRPQPEET